jgi:hypothetical protein
MAERDMLPSIDAGLPRIRNLSPSPSAAVCA